MFPLEVNLITELEQYLNQNAYAQVIDICEQALEKDPDCLVLYRYLGLAFLLHTQEAEAQLVWMTPILETKVDEATYIQELSVFLECEAERQQAQSKFENTLLIRRYLCEFDEQNTRNLLQAIDALITCEKLDTDDFFIPHLIETLQQNGENLADSQILQSLVNLLQTLIEKELLDIEIILHLAEILTKSPLVNKYSITEFLLSKARNFNCSGKSLAASKIGNFCLQTEPENLDLIFDTITFLEGAGKEKIWESIRLAEQCLEKVNTLGEKVAATHHILAGLMSTGGQWQKACEVYLSYKSLISNLVQSNPQLSERTLARLVAIGAFFFYFEDAPETNRPLRNQLASLCQRQFREGFHSRVVGYQNQHLIRDQPPVKHKKLKIGYLSECLRQHSVGWLVRWLFEHHNAEEFDIHLYSSRPTGDYLQQLFMQNYGDHFHAVPFITTEIADQISQDEIDILVDLDSITSACGSTVMSLKPAPVQITWLGYDASGIPAIDYFIADPYVLPEDAQNYYSEKIYRLPSTYIAVDGFEVGVPTLRREDLGIPDDAIVYFSSQTGLKRHLDNARLQVKILKEVPNSYFLIKGLRTDPSSIQEFFGRIAQEEGIELSRLHFLPPTPSEAIHRANLEVADVVLDTYPYNGATTTLETLWMGIPLVTKVGKQFAARNSYSMMMNAGITEGIAWTDQEYINWGVRLGRDENLRQEIGWKLKASRKTSILWNAKQFTQDMETAYKDIWLNH